MTHYFSKPENIIQNRREFSFRFLGIQSTFTVDDGIFSKDKADFGSLLLVEEVIKRQESGAILDLGSGYGLMSILVAQHLKDVKITGIEINPRALDCAQVSAAKSNLEISFIEGDATKDVRGLYDVVITNPPIRAGKEVVFSFLKTAHDHLKLNGRLYFVIRRQQGVASAVKYIQDQFESVERCLLKKGYEVWLAQNPLTSLD